MGEKVKCASFEFTFHPIFHARQLAIQHTVFQIAYVNAALSTCVCMCVCVCVCVCVCAYVCVCARARV